MAPWETWLLNQFDEHIVNFKSLIESSHAAIRLSTRLTDKDLDLLKSHAKLKYPQYYFDWSISRVHVIVSTPAR